MTQNYGSAHHPDMLISLQPPQDTPSQRCQLNLLFTDVVALLKSTETPQTVEVQCRGYSQEVTLPENFDETWNTMESCRSAAKAQALQQASADAGPAKPAQYEEVDEDTEGEPKGGLGQCVEVYWAEHRCVGVCIPNAVVACPPTT